MPEADSEKIASGECPFDPLLRTPQQDFTAVVNDFRSLSVGIKDVFPAWIREIPCPSQRMLPAFVTHSSQSFDYIRALNHFPDRTDLIMRKNGVKLLPSQGLISVDEIELGITISLPYTSSLHREFILHLLCGKLILENTIRCRPQPPGIQQFANQYHF